MTLLRRSFSNHLTSISGWDTYVLLLHTKWSMQCDSCVYWHCSLLLWQWSDELRSGHALRVLKAIKACVRACVHSCWLDESDSPKLLLRSLQSECTWGFKTRKGNLQLFHSFPLVQGAACSNIYWGSMAAMAAKAADILSAAWCFHLFDIIFFLHQLNVRVWWGNPEYNMTIIFKLDANTKVHYVIVAFSGSVRLKNINIVHQQYSFTLSL